VPRSGAGDPFLQLVKEVNTMSKTLRVIIIN
jgi:hypothetical protein